MAPNTAPTGYRLVRVCRDEHDSTLVVVYQRLDRADAAPDRAQAIILADRLRSREEPPPSRRAA